MIKKILIAILFAVLLYILPSCNNSNAASINDGKPKNIVTTYKIITAEETYEGVKSYNKDSTGTITFSAEVSDGGCGSSTELKSFTYPQGEYIIKEVKEEQ